MNKRISTSYLLLDGKLLSGNGNNIFVNNQQIITNSILTGLSGYLVYQSQKTISSNTSITNSDSRIYCDNTSPITLTMPNLISVSGMAIQLKLINTGVVNVTGTFGQKFDGSDSYSIVGQYQTREFHAANGTNWYIW